MLTISAQNLAELLSGIARAQAAIINGIESANPGTRSGHIVPALQNVAHFLDHPNPTLTDLPVRVVLSYMGRVTPDMPALQSDLERLFSESEPVAESAATLDFSAPSTVAT
jgi:hypothetical protein